MPEYPWIIYRMSEGPLTVKEVHQGVNEQLNRKLGTDWGYSEYEWAELLQGFRPLPIKTASGSIAHFTDGADDVPLKSLTAQIVPIQSGTGDPSPSNPRPISGTSVLNVEQRGKNRVNLVGTEIASNYDPADPVPFEDGYIIKGKTGNSGYIRPSTTSFSITGDSITVQASLAHYGVGFVIKVEPTQTITVSLASGSKYGVNFYDSAKKYMSSLSYYTEEHTFTIPSGAYWLIVVLVPNNLNTDETFVKVQAEFGSTPTTYTPYQSAEYPVPLNRTIYGGTADVVGGTGEETHKAVDLGSLTWTYHPASGQYSDFFDCYLPSDSITGVSGIAFDGLCSIYESIPSGNIATSGYDNNVMALAQGTRRFLVCDQRFTSKNDFVAGVTGITLVYPLETPTEYTFTGQPINSFEGVNNVWTDSGDVAVEYRSNF